MTRPRVGTVFLPGWEPETLRDVARTAEESGLDDVWLWEDCFHPAGPSSAAVALASTERITVGIGLMPAPLRHVALAAMEISALQRMFPGRFVPVIGHGVQHWMGQLGLKPASPLTQLTEYATTLQGLLAGDTVTVHGDYVTVDGVALDHPPATRHLLIGGEGPKTLRLAATHGDGTMLTSALSEERIRDSIAIIREVVGDRPHEVVGHLMVFRGQGARERMAAELSSWNEGSSALLAEGPDAAADIAAAVDRVGALGMTTVLVHSTADEPDPMGFVEWVGRDVLPRVSA